MAVDSRAKRFGMMGFCVPEPSGILFDPDGTIDDDDRAYLLGLYGGLALDVAGGVTTRQKRFAMMSFGVPFQCAAIMFEADGTINADDRAHMLYLYNWFTGVSDLERFQNAAGIFNRELVAGDYVEVFVKLIEGTDAFLVRGASGIKIIGPL